ncbi:MAG TPA: trypsin-like peptidase domain-containing protein [Ideonella sp.]|nr:trypsin-like peptidase domain-containing protein [Ideonella sp.]
MKKVPLYSRSRRIDAAPPAAAEAAARPAPTDAPAASAGRSSGRWTRLASRLRRHERALWAGAVVLLLAGAWIVPARLDRGPKPLTFEQIDKALRRSFDDKPLASPARRAYEAVLPSVVRVTGLLTEGDDGSDAKEEQGHVQRGVGSGVVIIENGTILTNLHVVAGARRVRVTFFDGSETDAAVIGTRPEHDLAVLKARTLPDDLKPATMRSTGDLLPGDRVIAIGFPFGIGPSVSDGVVSGLKRQFRSPEGQQMLGNLIQFDAAANPGNSGGPLVTMDGEVVGIVTAILNPTRERVFIGIGFAVPIEDAASAAGMPPF